jgi:hypothetical protein
MENMEIVQVIRSSAGVVEVLCTHIVPTDSKSPIRKEKVAKAEETFRAALVNLDVDDIEEALGNEFGDDGDGDCVNFVWSEIDA